jgi:hypothetical protein
VNDEMTVLLETGCYADFTMPAAPDPAQSRIVNSIYYSVDDPDRSRSYDHGVAACVGAPAPRNSLLMIQGPLSVYRGGRWGVAPRLDNSSLDSSPGHLPTLPRFERWVRAGVSVKGRPDWVVVKLHSHCAKEANADVLLGAQMAEFHQAVATACSNGGRYILHYMTAREIANIVRAAENGLNGNPGDYRDYVLRTERSNHNVSAGAARMNPSFGHAAGVEQSLPNESCAQTCAHV